MIFAVDHVLRDASHLLLAASSTAMLVAAYRLVLQALRRGRVHDRRSCVTGHSTRADRAACSMLAIHRAGTTSPAVPTNTRPCDATPSVARPGIHRRSIR